MLDVEYQCLLKFVKAVLKDMEDKHGISEQSFLRLRQLTDSMYQCQDHAERSHLIEGLVDRVCTEYDRYWLPEK